MSDDKERALGINWVRGPRRADLSKVTALKLQAAYDRGFRFQIDDLASGNGGAEVTKIVIQGEDQD